MWQVESKRQRSSCGSRRPRSQKQSYRRAVWRSNHSRPKRSSIPPWMQRRNWSRSWRRQRKRRQQPTNAGANYNVTATKKLEAEAKLNATIAKESQVMEESGNFSRDVHNATEYIANMTGLFKESQQNQTLAIQRYNQAMKNLDTAKKFVGRMRMEAESAKNATANNTDTKMPTKDEILEEQDDTVIAKP